MGQLAFVVLVVVAGIVGWRMLKREQSRVAERLRDAENRSRTGTLEKDPESGVYRPVDKQE
jgi:membrane protein implicated in regulation of membrane protease activity